MDNKTNVRTGTNGADAYKNSIAGMHHKDKDTPPVQQGQPISPEELIAEVVGLAQPPKEITGEDLLNSKIESIPCLVEPFLQKVGLACLAGSSDVGKSSLLRQLAICVATGSPDFLGFTIRATHHSAIVVSTEDDQMAISFLLSKQAKQYQPERLKNLRFIFDTENLLSELDARLTAQPADLVVVDCFADAYAGDLKDTQKIRSYLHHFHLMAEKHQCLFLFLHHTGKRTENIEPSKNNLLSGQGFEAKMRLVIELRQDTVSAATRHFCIVKGNYLPAEYKRESYVLEFVPDSFLFFKTGSRIPFEMLTKRSDDEGRAKYEQARDLRDKGHTLEEIAKQMGYANRGSVSKLLKKFDNVSGDVSNEETEETN